MIQCQKAGKKEKGLDLDYETNSIVRKLNLGHKEQTSKIDMSQDEIKEEEKEILEEPLKEIHDEHEKPPPA